MVTNDSRCLYGCSRTIRFEKLATQKIDTLWKGEQTTCSIKLSEKFSNNVFLRIVFSECFLLVYNFNLQVYHR